MGTNFANLAEHHFRVAWTALLLAKHEGRGDSGKILKMSLCHDLAESRTGDLHHISRQYSKRDEKKAITDVFLNTSVDNEMTTLWKEFEAGKSIEAQIVRDADWLDVDLELAEQKAIGRRHMNSWFKHRDIIYKKFHTKSAQKLWKRIQSESPTTWYDNARSRYNDGDMKG